MTVSKTQLEKLGISFVKEARGISEYRLDKNGLKIVLAENHVSPVVTVMPLYRVGSRNEAVGHTGATHILEHMMFKGVKNGRTGEVYSFDDIVKPIGGVFNATTWFDRTNYFEVVPKDALESCIAVEADRMRNLVLNDAERASEMTVVRNELERGENEPTRVLLQQMYAMAFREHPYHHPTIGWVSDVENITIERLKEFYDVYYWPDNTTVLVMGDFDSAHALELIAKYYGVYPSAPHPIPQVHTVEPRQEGERRFVINRPGDAAHIQIGYHVPQALHADTYALAVAADVLGGSRSTSRFYKACVETGLAADIGVFHAQQRDPGMFIVMATVAPGATVAALEAAIFAELENLAKNPVTEEELRRVKIANSKSTALATSDPMAMANQLAEAESVADWTFFVEYDDKFAAVKSEDISGVVGTYFTSDNRTVGHFIPKEDVAVSNEPAPAPSAPATDSAGTAQFAPRTQKVTLSNGATLLLMPANGNNVVGVSGKLAVGASHAPEGAALVPALTSSQLTAGTVTRTQQEISAAFEEMGTNVGFRSGAFGTSFTTQVARGDLSSMLSLIGDMLRNPAFPEKQLAVAKMQWLSRLEQMLSDTESQAALGLSQALYPEGHVYHDVSFETLIEQLKKLTTDDLRAFHNGFYSPKGMVLSLVGDFDVAEAVAAVEAAFGTWTGPEVKPVEIGEVEMPSARRRIDIEIPGQANASIVIGHPSTLHRGAEDFFAARLANAALGGGSSMSARLFDQVRRVAGLTYGIYSKFDDVTRGGAPWMVELSVNPVNVEKALVLIDKVIADYIENGIFEKELAIEAASAAGSYVVQLRRFDAIAAALVDYHVLGLGIEAMDDYASQVKSVTKEQVDAAIRKYIRPESFVTVVAGSLKK